MSILYLTQLAEKNFTIGSRGKQLCFEVKRSQNTWIKQLNCFSLDSFQDGFDRLATQENFAMGEGSIFSTYKIREKFTNKFGVTSKMLIKECFLFWHVVFILPKGSPLKEDMSKIIMRMTSAGIIQKYFKDEMDKVAIVSTESKKAKNIPLNLHHLQGVFLVYGVLSLGAIGAFLYEKI